MATHPLWRAFQPHANADRQSQRVAARQTRPGAPGTRSGGWTDQYEQLRDLIGTTIPDQVIGIGHVGSTAVAGLMAKPVIDIDLTVPDARDEIAYLPRLEAVGFRLIFRDDLGGDPHRQLTFAAPNTNLHVWSPGAVEPRRHAAFVIWLRDHARDRARYAAAKLSATEPGRSYNDAKAAVVYDIYEAIFAADLADEHDPQPR